MSTRFLYYFFLCLCKSFKELALFMPSPKILSESGCKGTTIFSFPQTFYKIFFRKTKSFRIS